MPRMVRGGLIQATLCEPVTSPIEKIKQAMIDKHVALIGLAFYAANCRNLGLEIGMEASLCNVHGQGRQLVADRSPRWPTGSENSSSESSAD